MLEMHDCVGDSALAICSPEDAAMHDGHDLWLKVIKERSEKRN